MDQKGKSLRDEIHKVIYVQKPNSTEDEWLSTNHEVETVSDFEMFSEQLGRIVDDPHRWKWAIIALHSGLQGMMVLALKGSNAFNVIRGDDKKQRLASFFDLYKKIKGDRMEMYCHSRKFVPARTQDRSVKQLNRFRNEFIHFTPKHWLLETAGLPVVSLDCLKIAEFLAWESGNVFLVRRDLNERLKTAFTSVSETLSVFREQTE